MMGILAIITLAIFVLFYRTILFISFDEEYARSHNAPVETFNYLMLTLVALVIVINIRVAGIILVISYLTIPQSTANLFVNDLKKIIILSMAISFTGSLTGLFLSYYWNIPSGATIIFVFVLIFMLARGIVFLRNIKQRKSSVTT
jgi:zinc transport system permease protein